MRALIDMEDLRVLHVHESADVLRNLDRVQAQHMHTALIYVDGPQDFNRFTDFELKLFLRNSGAGDHASLYSRPALLQLAFDAVRAMPAVAFNGFELSLQSAYLDDDDEGAYTFVPGKQKPVPGLVEYAALQCVGGPLKAPANVPQHVVQAPVAASPAAPAPPAAGSDFAQPRPGTSTHAIFAFCAKLWKDAGCTADEGLLGDIRKKAVDELVPTGLNVSTVRTQAMRWHQNRQRFAG